MKKLMMLIMSSAVLATIFLIISSTRHWILLSAILLLLCSALLVFRKRSTFWLASLCFSVYTILAVWNLLDHAVPLLAISGEVLAFICWDLLIFHNELQGNKHEPELILLVNRHIQVLLLVMLTALLFSTILITIQFKLPFLAILSAGCLGIFGFFHFYRTADKQ